MLRIWKLVRVLWAMLTRTPYVNWQAAKRSGAEVLRFRAHRIHVGCRLLCHILGISVRTEGSDAGRGGMLVVSNHFGVFDPLILASVLPAAPVGKAEMKRWPIVGWVSLAHGMIPVERERRSAVAEFTRLVGERLSAGVNVLVFPEGTTSADLPVRPFKTGAFEAVAGLEHGAVLPVYLGVEAVDGRPAEGDARRRVVWAGGDQSFVEHAMDVAAIRSLACIVRIGTPIPTRDRDRKELAQLAHEAVEHLRMRPETIDM